MVVLAVAASAVVPLAVGLLQRPGPEAQLPIPALAGDTLAAYVRTHDPAVAPGAVTYQPEGYTVFQPGGRVVHIALRCRGAGTVVIAAGEVESFRCTGDERRFLRSDGRRRSEPFTITATTTGDVVWAVRVTLRSR